MSEEKKEKGKAIKLPETEKEDTPLPTKEDINKAQDFARRVSPLALALFEAKETKTDT